MGARVFGHATALAALIASSLGCGSGDDRPPCNVGNCFDEDGGVGDGDADTDADGDGDGDADAPDCTDPDGDDYVDWRCEGGDDCAEGDPDIHPGATEVCNGLDDDCANGVDDGLLVSGVDSRIEPTHGAILHIALAGNATGFGLLTLDQGVDGAWHLLFTELAENLMPTGAPLVVSESPNYLYYDRLALVALADQWLVAFGDTEDRGYGETGVLTLANVQGGQVTTGPVIGDSEVPTDMMPAVAVGVSTFALLWQHANSVFRYAVLDKDDLSIVQEGDLAEAASQDTLWPDVVWARDRYVVSLVDADHELRLMTLDENGDVTSVRSGVGTYSAATIAWNDFELGVVATDTYSSITTDYLTVDASATVRGATPLDLFKTPFLAGAPRVFALFGVRSVQSNTLRGTPELVLIEPVTGVTTELEFDEANTLDAIDPQVVAAADGWVVAWIDDNHGVRLDRIACP